MHKVRIWDLPTRVFHWALVCAVAGLFLSAHLGGNAMVWHFRLGYFVLSLLIFRIFWGFAGGFWSRWAQLPIRAVDIKSYLQGRWDAKHKLGHNPLGSLFVLAMLSLLLFQFSTGLIADDEISNRGPLSVFFPGTVVSWATAWHKETGKLILLALLSLHLLALLWHRFFKKEKLVAAMWHGDKSGDNAQVSKDNAGSRFLALFLFAAIMASVFSFFLSFP